MPAYGPEKKKKLEAAVERKRFKGKGSLAENPISPAQKKKWADKAGRLAERKRVDAHAARIRGTKPGSSKIRPGGGLVKPRTPSRPRGEQVSEGLTKGTVMEKLTQALTIKKKDKKK